MADDSKPKDPEKEKLQRDLDLATLQAQIATQQRTALLQSLPPTDVKPIDAKTTVDSNDVIEAEILAYRALGRVAEEIAKEVKKQRTIVIHNDADMAAWNAFRTFVAQLQELGAAYDAIAPPPPTTIALAAVAITGTGVVAVTAAVKTVIDLIALFRVERNVYGVPITMEDLALVSEVAKSLTKVGCKVLITQLYPRQADGAAIARALDRVREQAAAATARVAKMTGDPAAEKQRLQQLDEIRKGYEDLFTHVAAEGTTALATLARGAGMNALMADTNVSVLYLKVLKAAGTNETKKSLFGSSLKHSGGVVVNFICFGSDGEVVASGVHESYSGEFDQVPLTP